MRRPGIARDLCALALAVLGALALIALGTLLASRGEWLALGLLAGAVVGIGAGVAIGRYDPDAVRPARREPGADQIVMRPVVRQPPIEPEDPTTP